MQGAYHFKYSIPDSQEVNIESAVVAMSTSRESHRAPNSMRRRHVGTCEVRLLTEQFGCHTHEG